MRFLRILFIVWWSACVSCGVDEGNDTDTLQVGSVSYDKDANSISIELSNPEDFGFISCERSVRLYKNDAGQRTELLNQLNDLPITPAFFVDGQFTELVECGLSNCVVSCTSIPERITVGTVEYVTVGKKQLPAENAGECGLDGSTEVDDLESHPYFGTVEIEITYYDADTCTSVSGRDPLPVKTLVSEFVIPAE